MWEQIKELGKPVGLVILGVLGAKMIESGVKSGYGAIRKGIASFSQSAENQATTQTEAKTETPVKTAAEANAQAAASK